MNAPWHTLLGTAWVGIEMREAHEDYSIPCSCGCGQPLTNPELHHGIITKAQSMKIKGAKNRRLINHPCNFFLVNHECHQNVPGPSHFWKLSCERFGTGNVLAWYEKCQGMFKRRLETYECS